VTKDREEVSKNDLRECISILDSVTHGYNETQVRDAYERLGDLGGVEAASYLAEAMMHEHVLWEEAMLALAKIDEDRAVALFMDKLVAEREIGGRLYRYIRTLKGAWRLIALARLSGGENTEELCNFVLKELSEISQVSDGSFSINNENLMGSFVRLITGRKYVDPDDDFWLFDPDQSIPALTELFRRSENLNPWKRGFTKSLRHCIISNLIHDKYSRKREVIRGEGALSLIMEGFSDNRAYVRISAAEALSITGGDDARDAMIEGLVDRSEKVVSTCIYSLSDIRDRRSVAALVKALKSKRESTRGSAASALGRIGEAVTVPHLIQALKDPSENVRSEVCLALGRIGDERALGALAEMKEDESWFVRHNSFVSRHVILENIESDHGVKTRRYLYSEIGYLAEKEIGDEEISQIIRLILERGGGLEILGGLASRRTDLTAEYLDQIIEQFVGEFDEKTRSMREYAVEQLVPIGFRAVPILKSHLEGSSWRVRDSIAEALGFIGGPVSQEALGSLLDDEDEDVRERASWALERIEQGI